MTASARPGVTKLLRDLRAGKTEVLGALFERVYSELKKRARGQRKRWKGDPTVRTTALAHEAYLKLVDREEQSWKSRSHFFAVAAKAMRHLLIDHARRKKAHKRGGEKEPLSLEKLRESLDRRVATGETPSEEEKAELLVVLDEALSRLEEKRPRAARVVECRIFSRMTIEETAESLSISASTVSRDWKQAKGWLYREMKRIQGEGKASEAPDCEASDSRCTSDRASSRMAPGTATSEKDSENGNP